MTNATTTTIPAHILNDKTFIQYLRDWEREQLIIDSAKDEQKAIAENCKDRFDVKPADFTKLAKCFYEDGLAQKKLNEAEDLFHAAEIVRAKK
ncbi:MAG: hypothetical protein CME43_01890 [Haliea sp.]|uniref:hypothetical protein n=1 Tax=Haliea sp. TaxID=1932666 RepID=UPI000C43FA73|nr:hypothetical protein [Haliea sp.]MBM68170.1 hypothetical protein [Haliea sp.]MBM68213.1 hypothetical protein [Haliea sp.]|tara:strand:+ start:53 stop:331 length:279 start_codon:yes stop_codon:yes gene_type:complete